MGNLSDFNSGMAAYNSGKLRQDNLRVQVRQELISAYSYAIRMSQPLPERAVPGRSMSLSLIKTIKKGKENERLKIIQKLEETEFNQFRKDYESGAVTPEAALGWLDSLK